MTVEAQTSDGPARAAAPAVTPTSAQPVNRPPSGSKKQRLIGIDVTRGLALLGMMAVHALIPFDENYNPNWVTYVATGNASAVFALLAGVGLSLTTGRAAVPWSRASTTAAAVATRALVIGVIGLLLGYTSAEIAGVILPYYAVMFLLAIPLLFLRTPTLILVGLCTAVAVPVLSMLVRPALPEATLENPTFIYLFSHPLQLLSELLVTGAYPALPWASYIIAGLVVGRLRLSSAKVARRMLVFGCALAVTAATTSWWLLGPKGGAAALRLAAPGPLNPEGDGVDDLLAFGFDGTTPTGSWWWLATDAPHAATPADLLRTIGTAVAVLGGVLLLHHVVHPRWQHIVQLVGTPLAAAGSMTLTLYAAHIVFMNSPLDQFSPVGGYVFQVTAVLLLALGWRQAVGRGPLETLVSAAADRAKVRAAEGRRAVGARVYEPVAALAAPAAETGSGGDEGRARADDPSTFVQSEAPRRALTLVGAPPREAMDQDVWSWWPEGVLDDSSDESAAERSLTVETWAQDTWWWWPESSEGSPDLPAEVPGADAGFPVADGSSDPLEDDASIQRDGVIVAQLPRKGGSELLDHWRSVPRSRLRSHRGASRVRW